MQLTNQLKKVNLNRCQPFIERDSEKKRQKKCRMLDPQQIKESTDMSSTRQTHSQEMVFFSASMNVP
jgi:hypothetical protein